MQKWKLTICVWRGKAYLPSHGQFPSGIYALMEPVCVAELEIDSLTSAAKQIMTANILHLPEVKAEEWRKRSDPLLKATKARSWKELARSGALYTIGLTDQHIRLDMSYRDKQGRWQNDPAKVRIFASSTPLEKVIAVILDDMHLRPELWDAESHKREDAMA